MPERGTERWPTLPQVRMCTRAPGRPHGNALQRESCTEWGSAEMSLPPSLSPSIWKKKQVAICQGWWHHAGTMPQQSPKRTEVELKKDREESAETLPHHPQCSRCPWKEPPCRSQLAPEPVLHLLCWRPRALEPEVSERGLPSPEFRWRLQPGLSPVCTALGCRLSTGGVPSQEAGAWIGLPELAKCCHPHLRFPRR